MAGKKQSLESLRQQIDSIDDQIHDLLMRRTTVVEGVRGKVVDLQLAKSWRPFYAPSQAASYILEIHPDRLVEFDIGDELGFEEN